MVATTDKGLTVSVDDAEGQTRIAVDANDFWYPEVGDEVLVAFTRTGTQDQAGMAADCGVVAPAPTKESSTDTSSSGLFSTSMRQTPRGVNLQNAGVCLRGRCFCVPMSSGAGAKLASGSTSGPHDAVRSALGSAAPLDDAKLIGDREVSTKAAASPDFLSHVATVNTSDPRVDAILITTRVGERVVHYAGARVRGKDGRVHVAVARVAVGQIGTDRALTLAAQPMFAATYTPTVDAGTAVDGPNVDVDDGLVLGSTLRPKQSPVLVGMGNKDAYVGIGSIHKGMSSDDDGLVSTGGQVVQARYGPWKRPRRHSGVMVGMGQKDAYVGKTAPPEDGSGPLFNATVALSLMR